MKIQISQFDLLESLKIVSRAVSGANTLPVLGNIMIKAEGKKVYFAATNLELSITTSKDAIVKNEGAITIPAKILTSYVSLLKKDEDVDLSVADGTTLEVKSKTSKTKIKGISADEFPSIATVDAGIKMELDAPNFRESVHKVAFSAQENSSRPILAGVYFATEKNKLTMAATDSYRLSEKVLTLGSDVEKATCVIPVRAVSEADRLASGAEKVHITIAENQVMFTVGDTNLTSRLIDGQFPDYTQIIPKSALTKLEIPKGEFELAVRRVSIFARQNNQHMKLEVQGDGNLLVSTDATEIGEDKTTIAVKVDGSSNAIALNADYVLDVLSSLAKEETIIMELDSKMSPAVFKGKTTEGFVHLIMPLKM